MPFGPGGGSAVSGSGTPHTVPVWAHTTELGDSHITDTPLLVDISGVHKVSAHPHAPFGEVALDLHSLSTVLGTNMWTQHDGNIVRNQIIDVYNKEALMELEVDTPSAGMFVQLRDTASVLVEFTLAANDYVHNGTASLVVTGAGASIVLDSAGGADIFAGGVTGFPSVPGNVQVFATGLLDLEAVGSNGDGVFIGCVSPAVGPVEIQANGLVHLLSGTTDGISFEATNGPINIAADTDILMAGGPGDKLQITNLSLIINSVGAGIKIKEGSNATLGTTTLVAGAALVSTTKVTANSRIFLAGQNNSGTAGALTVSTLTAGTSFTILSTSNTDTRSIAWWILEPA